MTETFTPTQDLASKIKDEAQKLAVEFASKVPQEVIDATIQEAFDGYQQVLVNDFVPLFVGREARQRLLAIQQTPQEQ